MLNVTHTAEEIADIENTHCAPNDLCFAGFLDIDETGKWAYLIPVFLRRRSYEDNGERILRLNGRTPSKDNQQ